MVVDVIAGIVLLASTLISILRGFIREVLTILGVVGGAIAGYIGGPLLSPLIKNWMGVVEESEEPQKFFDIVSYEMLADWIAYAAVFMAFVIILSIISHFLAESVRNVGLGIIDRTLGMVFGLARGVLFLGLFYLPVYYLVDAKQAEDWAWLNESRSRVYLEATSRWIAGFIPEKSVENITNVAQDAKMMNDARTKLQEMDLLQTKENSEESESSETLPENEALETAPVEEEKPEDETTEGYSDNFRSEMDDLIERTTEMEEE